MRALALPFVLAVAACVPRDDAPADGSSAAVPDSGRPADSTASAPRASTDTSVHDVTVTTTSAAVRDDSILSRDSIIGRDSAFGPKYMIDSTGKLVRIRRP